MKNFHFRRGQDYVFDFALSSSAGQSERKKIFHAKEGEVCVYLSPSWEQLLSDMGGMGEMVVVSQNAHLRMAGLSSGLDFTPSPMSTRFVELTSGLIVDSGEWLFALSVEERVVDGALLGLQFFDMQGRGQLKLLLANREQVDAFLALTMFYGLEGEPPMPRSADAETSAPLIQPDRALLRALWPTTRHELGECFFPGLPGVKRLTALQSAGEDLARRVTFEEMLAALVAVRRWLMPLDCGLMNGGLWHQVRLAPRALERCAHGAHIFDSGGEFHIVPGEGWQNWAIRTKKGVALEFIDEDGTRLGMIECAGEPAQCKVWEGMFFGGGN